MDEELLDKVYDIGIRLQDGYKLLKRDLIDDAWYNIDNIMNYLLDTIKYVDTLLKAEHSIAKFEIDCILMALNLLDQYEDKSIPIANKTLLIVANDRNLRKEDEKGKVKKSRCIKAIIFDPKKYSEYEDILNQANEQVISLNKKRAFYISNINHFNQTLRKIGMKKIRVIFNFDGCSDIIDYINVCTNIEDIKYNYNQYLYEISNTFISICYEKLNVKNENEIPLCDTKDEYLDIINKRIENLENEIEKSKLGEAKIEMIDMIESKYSLLIHLGIDYKDDVLICDSINQLNTLVEKYDSFLKAATTILMWSSFLDIDISIKANEIKSLVNDKGIDYIVNNRSTIIHNCIVSYIEEILKNKFNLENAKEILSTKINEIIKNYDMIDDVMKENNIELIVKESIRFIIKDKIKAIPKKLFKSQITILSTFNDNFEVFYDQLYKGEINIDELIQLIITEDEYFNELQDNINKEIELILMFLNTDKESTLNELNSFISSCLEKYKDNETKIWILNYLKKHISNNIELQNTIDKYMNGSIDEGKNDSNNDIEEVNDDNTTHIPYILLNNSFINDIDKTKFYSNDEYEKYLNNLREYLNHLITGNYKNNNKFTLKKYQKSNLCWKFKKSNNEMLLRMIINFEKDNIIISSFFKRPKTNKKYDQYIIRAESSINNTITNLQNNDVTQKLQFLYNNILNLIEVYNIIHNNISNLSNEEKIKDNELLTQIIIKFINEFDNINYTILPLRDINELNTMKTDIINILQKLKSKNLTK